MVYDAGQNSRRQPRADRGAPGSGSSGRCRPPSTPTCSPCPPPATSVVDAERYPGLTCRRHPGHRARGEPPRGAHPLTEPARRPIPRVRPDPGQGPPPPDRAAGHPGPRRAPAATGPPSQAEIDTITRPRWVSQVITITLTGDNPAELRLTFRTDARARAKLEKTLFGKRILFTNRDDWTTADVVAGYRSQSEVEAGFRQMKDPHVVSFGPMHHWTDSKIRVHVFYCVLALSIAHLMRREADQAGLHLSVRELLSILAGIQETVLLYHDGGKGRPRAQRMLTDKTPPNSTWPTCSASTATHPPADHPNTAT